MSCHPTTVEFLFSPGDPCAAPALRLLRNVLEELGCGGRVTVRVIADERAAVRHRFHGSPTIRIDGVDIEGPSVEREGYRLRCRIYESHGELPGVPDPQIIRAALQTHPGLRRPARGA
jgi:hypothetical protein